MYIKKIVLAVAACVASPLALAQTGAIALGLSGGTLGIGVEGIYGLTDHLNIRAAVHGFDVSTDIENDGSNELDYKGDLELSNIGLGIDYHPWAGGFRLSAGVQISDNRAGGSATCTQVAGCDFGDQPNVIPNGDSATVDIDMSGTHPYVTFGWGNAASEGIPFGVYADIGVMFQGTPVVTVTADCSAPATANCNNQAENEEKELQEDANDFEVYPIVNVGFRWRFK